MSFPDSVHALVRDTTVVWGFVTAVGIVLLLTPLVARLAPWIGGVDDKHDRPRVHGDRPIPRIGGLAIVIGIAVPMAVFMKPEGRYLGILLGALMVAALGLIDDIKGINASVKMVGIVVAALIPVAAFGMTWESVGLPLVGNFDLGWVAYPLTVFWIAALANLVNLIDGMDSLASGIVAIAAGSFAILAVSFHRFDAAALAAIICGATLAFLRYNIHPARVFMGDTGALAIGFALAAMAIQQGWILLLPIVGLVFVLETLSVIIQVAYFKATGGRRIFTMTPIHYTFHHEGWSENRIALTFWGAGVVSALIAIALVRMLA